jgi:hypothetical protein
MVGDSLVGHSPHVNSPTSNLCEWTSNSVAGDSPYRNSLTFDICEWPDNSPVGNSLLRFPNFWSLWMAGIPNAQIPHPVTLKNTCWSLSKVPIINVQFSPRFYVLTNFSKTHEYQILWKPVQPFLSCYMCTDRRMDKVTLIGTAQGCKHMPKSNA